MASAPEAPDLRDRKITELLQELSQQTATLARKEVELAKAELAEKGKRAGAGAGLLGAAGVAGLLALGALTTAIVAALATAMPTWLAALIVAVIYGAVAGVLALIGRNRVQEAVPPAPEQTVETVKEDVQWVKTRARSGRT
jgi:Putative Actinobacterial Holin-X, holin superfamily III